MGLLGKLFEKKECDICGGEIGLLGNRKLMDGNLCKQCAAKLSPFMTDRRQSTIEEIRSHLAYREENEKALPALRATRILGNGTKVYLDEGKGVFWVSRFADWQQHNPDIIPLSQVMACDVDIRENKTELYRRTDDGKRERYDPPRYECDYAFYVDIQVDSPWFSSIDFELSDERPDSPYTDAYRDLERQADELKRALSPGHRAAAPEPTPQNAPEGPAESAPGGWFCTECGAKNTGNFCSACGAKRHAPTAYKCGNCGWTPENPAHPPKFCPNCGDRFDEGDRQ